MANDSRNVGIVDEDGEENELMLELSIGGIFAKSKKTKPIEKDNKLEEDLNMNVHSKREMQAIRRRELRKKREEKLKKSVGFGSCGSVSGPFVENKDWLEKQIVAQNENDDVLEPTRKKEKIGDLPENVNGKYASSAVSGSQCSSRQGGGTDESRSNSSNNSQLDHQQPASTSAASDGFDPLGQPVGSCKPTNVDPKDGLKKTPELSVPNPAPKVDDRSSENEQASIMARMPCVSTTGNGPNGKTVSGFLYSYTKNEVSIVCVCHGESFSPAGFVEHAGGVGVSVTHPLKHITILPTAFAS